MTYPPFGGTKEMKIHNGLHKAVETFQISMKSLVYKYGHPLFKGCEKKTYFASRSIYFNSNSRFLTKSET